MKRIPPFLVAALLAAATPPVHGGVVLESSFETPRVNGRTPRSAGGDIASPGAARLPGGDPPVWGCFEDQPDICAGGGSVVAGVTNEVARTGAQALFIAVSRLSAPYLGASFATRPVPVEGGGCYAVRIWGRIPPGNPPSSAGEARLCLKIQVDFFTADGQTEAGESQYLLQPLPGGKSGPPLLGATGWTPLGLRVTAPREAKYMVVSFRCDSNAQNGAISGTFFLDDFCVETVP